MDVIIEKVEGQFGEVTTSTYKCSNDGCQKKADHELAKIVRRREEQEAAKLQRIENQRARNKKRRN